MTNFLQHMRLQYTSSLEVVRSGGGGGGGGCLGVERAPRGVWRGGGGGGSCADGLKVVAGQHVVGDPVGAAAATPAAEAVLTVLLWDRDHQIAEIHTPTAAPAAGGGGGGGEAEDLLVHELRRVHRPAASVGGELGGEGAGDGGEVR